MTRQWYIHGIVLLCLVVGSVARAQDPHYSQFYRDPVYLNPALTGTFDGTYRFTGHYRNQWSSISRAFETFGGSVDAANFLGVRKLGAGLMLFNDVAGDGNLSNLQANISLSYSIQLTSDSVFALVIGGQGGWYRRQIDFGALRFPDEIAVGGPTQDVFETSGIDRFNGSAGLALRGKWNARSQGLFGIALHNINSPNLSFTGADEPLDRRLSIHGQVQFPIHERFDLLPGFLLMGQGPHSEMMAGANLKYLLDTRLFNYRAVYLGGWVRAQDAVVLFGGLDWNDLQIGLSYDINTSGLERASNNRGGWEISVIYLIRHILPKRLYFKTCPDYI